MKGYTYTIIKKSKPYPYKVRFYLNGKFDWSACAGTLWGARREVSKYRKRILLGSSWVESGDVFREES